MAANEHYGGSRPGDVLVVWKLDRLGRSVRDLITLRVGAAGAAVNFRSLTDSIDTSTPAGRFFFHVMSAWRKWSAG